MWDESYVPSVTCPRIEEDRFILDAFNESDDSKYEFLFDVKAKHLSVEKYDSKKILSTTYNIGKLIEEQFTMHVSDAVDNQKIISNVFLKAVFETHYEFQGRYKSIYTDIKNELGLNPLDNSDCLEGSSNYDKLVKALREYEHSMYINKIESLFASYGINRKYYNKLIKYINSWYKYCGVSKNDTLSSESRENFFPIIMLSYSIYKLIHDERTTDSVSINYNIVKSDKLKSIKNQANTKKRAIEISIKNVNDLIKLLAINFIGLNGYGYIYCSECGNLYPGTQKRKTCSEICKKIRNGSYNKKV